MFVFTAATSALLALSLVVTTPTHGTRASDDAAEIRAQRAAFNAAIAKHDASAIGAFLSADYQLVSSRNSQAHGVDENVRQWTEIFAKQPGVTYVRTPTSVRIYGPWAMAEETGRWIGQWRAVDGPVEVRGTFVAKWRKTNGRWLLTAEVFTPSYCRGGAACKEP